MGARRAGGRDEVRTYPIGHYDIYQASRDSIATTVDCGYVARSTSTSDEADLAHPSRILASGTLLHSPLAQSSTEEPGGSPSSIAHDGVDT